MLLTSTLQIQPIEVADSGLHVKLHHIVLRAKNVLAKTIDVWSWGTAGGRCGIIPFVVAGVQGSVIF